MHAFSRLCPAGYQMIAAIPEQGAPGAKQKTEGSKKAPYPPCLGEALMQEPFI
jgi:hypothetical protein